MEPEEYIQDENFMCVEQVNLDNCEIKIERNVQCNSEWPEEATDLGHKRYVDKFLKLYLNFYVCLLELFKICYRNFKTVCTLFVHLFVGL